MIFYNDVFFLGMGYKETNDQWTEHESNFSALLESLGGKTEKNENIALNSLEEKSQLSRARVHYKKFTRGKDLSRYSEKDLANIFGKRNLNEKKKKSEVEDSLQTEDFKETSCDNNGASYLMNAGSMKDYFKKKLPKLGRTNGYVVGKNGVLKKDDSESESELKPTFGFGFQSSKSDEDTAVYNNYKTTFVSYIESNNDKRKLEHQLDHNIFSPRKKIKKEKNSENGLSNPAFNPMCTPVKVIKHTLQTIDENSFEELPENETTCDLNREIENNFQSKKKSKKQKELFPPDAMDTLVNNFHTAETNENEGVQEVEVNELRTKNKKKHKKNCKEKELVDVGISNAVFNDRLQNTEEISEMDNNQYEIKVKKKSKNSLVVKTQSLGISNPGFSDRNNEINIENELESEVNDNSVENSAAGNHTTKCEHENPYEIKVKKKKKRINDLENPGDDIGITNPLFDNNSNDNMEQAELFQAYAQNPYEITVKKKRKARHNLEDESIKVQNLVNPLETNFNSYEVKRKKKKHKVQDARSVDNDLESSKELSNISDSDFIDVDKCDLLLNIISEPIVATQEKTEIRGIKENDLTRKKRRKSVRFSDVTQEHIIPNNEELRRLESVEFEGGLDNDNFDAIQNHVDENIDTISKTLDMYQAEIENDINEKKQMTLEDIMVGELGNPHGENEKVPGGTKLKLKHADLDTRTPMYQLNKTGARKSYKHLIKGDIVVKFNNTNLHDIRGYAVTHRNRETVQ